MSPSGRNVVFVPVFEHMLLSRSEYAPPAYFEKKGSPLFDTQAYARLQLLAPEVPDRTIIPQLTGLELVRALQWETPDQLLGSFPETPRLDTERLVGAHPGGLSKWLPLYAARLERARRAPAIDIRPAPAGARSIHFVPRKPGAAPWWVLVESRNDWFLQVAPGLIAVPTEASAPSA